MKIVYHLNFPIIFIFISVWISLVLTQFYKLVEDARNKKTYCYIAEGPNRMAVKVTTALPNVPKYLQMASEFNITVDNEESTFYSTRSTYDLILSQNECDNSFWLSFRHFQIKRAILSVEFYTAQGWGLFAKSLHSFLGEFDKNLHDLWDQKSFMSFSVGFRKDIDEFLPKSINRDMTDIVKSLAQVPAENACLCIISKNNPVLLLKSSSYTPEKPNEHVAALLYRYKRNDTPYKWNIAILPAYGCSCDSATVEEDVKLIFEHTGEFSKAFEVQFIDAHIPFHCQHGKPDEATELSVSGKYGLRTSRLGELKPETKPIFLMHTTAIKIYCTPTHIRYIHRSINGIDLFAFDFVEETFGTTKTFKWVLANPIECPPEK